MIDNNILSLVFMEKDSRTSNDTFVPDITLNIKFGLSNKKKIEAS